MKQLITLFVLLFSLHCFSQEYHIVDNVIINTKDYQVFAKFNKDDFNIKIATKTEFKESFSIIYEVTETVFESILINLINKELDTTLTIANSGYAINSILEKILKKKKALRSLTEIIDGEPAEYSGVIKLNTVVQISTRKPSKTRENQSQKLKEKIDETIKKFNLQNDSINSLSAQNQNTINVLNTIKDSIKDEDKIKYLHISKAYINFFNNKASTIVLEGKVSDSKEKPEDTDPEFTSENKNFSIPIRYFNSGISSNPIEINGDTYNIIYNDVFSFNADQHYNYSIANDELHFDKDKLELQVRQRQFFDFFTAVLYTDVMAFDNNNSNSLVNAQAKILLPLNQRNSTFWGYSNYTLFRQLTAEANIALYNGSTDNFRTIQTTKTVNDEGEDISRFNHFELLTKNNINGTLATEVFTHEAKRFFSHFSLGYSASFYRTAFSTATINSGEGEDAKDTEENAPLFSIAHGPYFNVEIRPQTNFGADVSVSFNHLTYNGSDIIAGVNIHDTIENDGVQYFGFKYNIINIKADFYWLTNPKKGKKGGIFARLGGYYHAGSYDFHPQLMVGYATNLTSFVNRFSTKEEVKK